MGKRSADDSIFLPQSDLLIDIIIYRGYNIYAAGHGPVSVFSGVIYLLIPGKKVTYMKKYCPRCGYISGERDEESKCPLCGKRFLTGAAIPNPESCDRETEKEFNNGYHDDFQEGRKTGEYCDERLEKYVNAGEHYYGTVKESYNKKTVGSAADNPVTEKIGTHFVGFSALISLLFPVFGLIVIYSITINDKENDSYAKARKVSLAVTILAAVLYIAANVYFDW